MVKSTPRMLRELHAADSAIHALVVVIVVVCAAVLTGAGAMSSDHALAVFSAAIGFAAGRSGTGQPACGRRTHDPTDG